MPALLETDSFDRLCALLDTIDHDYAGQSGRLVFGDAADGIVLIEAGRVCWAASPMMPVRLTDRLRQACTLDEHALQRAFRDCRANGKPFGETLVERGIVTSAVLRDALLQHNAETLFQIAALPAPQWQPATIEHEDHSFTFHSAELLAHSADSWWGPLAAAARNELHTALRGRKAMGMAFLRTGGPSGLIVPVGVTGRSDLAARALLAAGHAADRVLRTCGEIDGRLVSSTRPDGGTTVVWKDESAIYLATGEERSELAFVLAHLSRRTPE